MYGCVELPLDSGWFDGYDVKISEKLLGHLLFKVRTPREIWAYFLRVMDISIFYLLLNKKYR